MKLDLVLAGVGGQGILTIAYLLDHAAIAKNLDFKQAEVHGMSQRGGAVYSHLRINSDKVLSDLIPEGKADAILSMEPLEVGRYINFLNKNGMVFTSSEPFNNIPNYPSESEVLDFIFSLDNAVMLDTKQIAVGVNNPRGANIALLGIAIPYLQFTVEDFEKGIESLFAKKGEAIIEANKAVLRLSYKVGLMYKNLREAGISNKIVSKFFDSLNYKDAQVLDIAVISGLLKEKGERVLAISDKVSKINCTTDAVKAFLE